MRSRPSAPGSPSNSTTMAEAETPNQVATCPHDTVDESLWCPRWGRRFRSYREHCLNCGETRYREYKRFRWGPWSPWAKDGHCCLGLSDEGCAATPLGHCEGWVGG